MQLAILRERENLDTSSEESLVALARIGEERAIRTLIKRNNQRVFRVARSVLQDDFEAEDAVQESYVKAFTKLDTFRGHARFSTWLTRIVLNEAIGRKRRTRRSVDLTELDIAAFTNGSSLPAPPLSLAPLSADADLARREVRAILERLIDELPEAFRTVLALRDIEGLNVEETASLLGLKPATVKTRLHRAHRMVRAAIGIQLSESFSDVFPFDGARCAEMGERVVWDLRWLLARRGPLASAFGAGPASGAPLA